MTPLGKRIVSGAFIAASGAFVWAIPVFLWTNRSYSDWLWSAPLSAGYSVVITSWFVLPIGGIIGAVMPFVVRNCSRRLAVARGCMLGLCVGLIAATLTTLMMEWPSLSGQTTIVNLEAWWQSVRQLFFSYAASMCLVCVVWVGAWALRWSKRTW
jgi:hypothetical protein